MSFQEGRSARMDGAPGFPLEESGTSTRPPDLLVCTPALRLGGPGPPRAPLPLVLVHAGPLSVGPTESHRAVYRRPYISDDYAACRGWQDDRHDLRRTKDDIQDDCHARRHAPQCTSYSVRLLYPHDSGEDDDFNVLLLMYTAPPCDYKRMRRAPFKEDPFFGRSGHQRPQSPTPTIIVASQHH